MTEKALLQLVGLIYDEGRKECGMTVKALCAESGVGRTTYYKFKAVKV